MKGSLESRVKAVVSDFFNLPRAQVRLDFAFVDDLGADALDLIELVNALEAEFGVVIPRSEADTLISVRDVIAWLRAHGCST